MCKGPHSRRRIATDRVQVQLVGIVVEAISTPNNPVLGHPVGKAQARREGVVLRLLSGTENKGSRRVCRNQRGASQIKDLTVPLGDWPTVGNS